MKPIPGDKIFGIFLKDWSTLTEASAIYDKKYLLKGQNHPTVVRLFNSQIKKFCDGEKVTRTYPNPYINKRTKTYQKALLRFRINLPSLVGGYVFYRLGRKVSEKVVDEFKLKGKSELESLFGDQKIRDFFVNLYESKTGVESYLENIIRTCFFINELYFSLLEIRLNWAHPLYRSNIVKIGRKIYSKIKSTAFIKAIKHSLTSEDYNRIFILSFLMQEEMANNTHELLLEMVREENVLKDKGVKAWADFVKERLNLKYS